jgi:hypothetical protein
MNTSIFQIISNMIFDSQGTRKDERAAEAEIILSALLAFSMILLALFPPAGRILCLVLTGLIIIFYLVEGIRLYSRDNRHNVMAISDVVNYLASALVLIILISNVLWTSNRPSIALIAVLILFISLGANILIMKQEKTRNDHFAIKQIRLVILLVITLILVFTGRN